MSQQRRVRNYLRRLKHLQISISLDYYVNNSQGLNDKYSASGRVLEIKRIVCDEFAVSSYTLEFDSGKNIEFDIKSDIEFFYGNEKWETELKMCNGDGTYNYITIKKLRVEI